MISHVRMSKDGIISQSYIHLGKSIKNKTIIGALVKIGVLAFVKLILSA
jgi:hypothetical protein